MQFQSLLNLKKTMKNKFVAKEQIWEFTENELIHSVGYKCKSFLKIVIFNRMGGVA